MGKRRRLSALIKSKGFLPNVGGAFAAILGTVSAGLSLAGWHLSALYALLLTLAIGVVSFVFLQRRFAAAPQLIAEDLIPFGAGGSMETRLRCPADIRLVKMANDLADHCFSSTITIEANTFEQFRVKNPNIMACLTDLNGRLLGYFDAIPLRDGFAQEFIRGSVTEAQITHEDVLPPGEIAACRYLFISGIAAWDPDTFVGRMSASILVWALLQYLRKFYSKTQPIVFAVASTAAGDNLLRRFSLQLESDSTSRVDRYNLYSARLTQDEVAQRLDYLPDWSKLCRLDWEHSNVIERATKKRPGRPRIQPGRIRIPKSEDRQLHL